MATTASSSELPSGTTLLVGGVSFTVPALLEKLGHYQSFYAGAREKRAALHALIGDRHQGRTEVQQFLQSLKAALIGLYGVGNPVLEKFGFPPRKRAAPLTAEQRLARATKLKLTRSLRHTMGSRQKAPLKAQGTPTISVSMPAASPPAPDASPAPDAAVADAPAPEPKAPESSVPAAAPPASPPPAAGPASGHP